MDFRQSAWHYLPHVATADPVGHAFQRELAEFDCIMVRPDEEAPVDAAGVT